MLNTLLIAFGGALGAAARHLSFEMVIKLTKMTNFAYIPVATIFVNVLGSLLAGIFYYFMIKHFDGFDMRYKNFFMFGFLGAFTTFSAFSIDFLRLFQSGNYGIALAYAIASVILAILAVFLGFYLMKVLF